MAMNNESIVEIQNDALGEASSGELRLVDFWAPWCGPCRLQTPVLEALAEQAGDSLRIVKVNVDENPQLAGRFRIQSIPTLVLLDGDVEIQRFVGVQSLQLLSQAVQKAAQLQETE
jgi:thioredoxin 1